ncbi:MAG: Glu/Leu/Phe/Val dehydrogenase [Gammaproteobacteria bacterium]|nr:Glu/Leu/Phe/Val dehydrogenase [Gammaproteobacteria bacterium]
MAVFSQTSYADHESVTFVRDPAAGLRAIVAIHSTALGPAMGGCRMYAYPSDDAALADALRLSRGMSYKNAMAGLPIGGGKAVILGDPRSDKSEALLAAFGRAVDRLGGRYVTAEDVGITVADMSAVARHTRYVTGLPGAHAAGGDPSPKTARGVLHGIRAAARCALGRGDLAGLTVAVQGLGAVGYKLCRELHEQGARLVVADVNPLQVQRARDEFGATAVAADEILFQEVDVLAPCALGGGLSEHSIPRLRARVVAGGANNQLLTEADGPRLARRGILYAPDYVINAGGIIAVCAEYLGDLNEAQVWAKVTAIEDRLTEIFRRAAASGEATSRIADAEAETIIRNARARDAAPPLARTA